MATSSENTSSPAPRGNGVFFVVGMLVIACGVIGYLTIDRAMRSGRPAPAAFAPGDPPKTPSQIQ